MNSQAKMLEMQMHIRQNATELNDYLHDLDMWENDIKKQDETFSRMKPNQEVCINVKQRICLVSFFKTTNVI